MTRSPSGAARGRPEAVFVSSSVDSSATVLAPPEVSPVQERPRSLHGPHDVEKGDVVPGGREGAHHTEDGAEPAPRRRRPLAQLFARDGKLRPFRLLKQDLHNLRRRWPSDWTVFNQVVVASAVYVFFTNILPGITFASDLYVLTGKAWGTIEVVFSTGLCGVIFAL